MDFKLLTMEDCLDIVNKSEAFYMTETEIYGYKVRLFDYRLASFSDFKDNDAFEMRGLCFVQDGTLWTRHLLMNKFFNYAQCGMKLCVLTLNDGSTKTVPLDSQITLTSGEVKLAKDIKAGDNIQI